MGLAISGQFYYGEATGAECLSNLVDIPYSGVLSQAAGKNGGKGFSYIMP